MCGICGALALAGSPAIDPDTLTRVRDALAHRGPDGGANWLAPSQGKGGSRVGMGHRRLSIIDLSTAANQPMVSRDGLISLVFNGEIYNHAALRTTLEGLGVSGWQTSHSDTETILMAYRQWGMPGCLPYLRGMFAFALYDASLGKLFLARDRAGEKPLYYTTTPEGQVWFASEIKALLETGIPRAVDETALFHYLSFLMVPPPRTLFAGVAKLPAAHWAEITPDGTITTHKYWDALDAAADYANANTMPKTETEWLEHLEPILRQSVKLRQEAADVPVGVFLSGGVDSSGVAALVGGHTSKGKLQTFAIGPDATYPDWPDETPFAEDMARNVGSIHTTVRVTEADFLNLLPQFIPMMDEPVADPAALPIHMLAKAATKAGLKVCQGGEGGDEVFIGYDDWLKFSRLERWNRLPVPRWFKKAAYYTLVGLGFGHKFYVEYLRRAAWGQPLFWGGAEAFTHAEKQRLLGRNMQQFKGRSSYEVIGPLAATFATKPKAQRGFWNWCTWLELHLRLPEQLLMRADKTTMATALELRVPLLDHVLIAAMLNTPESLRAPGGRKKYLLKSMLEGVVPQHILHRKKQGLGLPLNSWVMRTYGPYAHTVLMAFAKKTGYLSPQAVEKLFRQQRGQHIWYLLNLALWYKYYIERQPLTPPR